MASVLIGLTALAVYRYIQKRRNSRSPEMLLINKCFPKELQLQIINDFDECVATFTASRYDKHQKTILLLKQQQLLNEENTETSNVSLDDDDPPKKSRFSFFMSRKKPGTTTSGSTSPARRSSNASTSSELAPFDPTVVRLEACTSLLILWALVDALKKGINRDVFITKSEDDDASERSSTPQPSDEESSADKVASEGSESSDGPTLSGVDSNLSDIKQEPTEDDKTDVLTPPSIEDRELELLTPLDTVTLLSLLQIIKAVESVLLDRFMFLSHQGIASIPSTLGSRRLSSLSSESLASTNLTLDDLTCDGYILHKISLGWGLVLMLLEARNTAELTEMVIDHGPMMEGSMDGFLVNSILKVLVTRGVGVQPETISMESLADDACPVPKVVAA